MTLKIAIAGAGGRMGRQLIQAVHNAEGAELGAAFERKGSSLVGLMLVSLLVSVH